MEEKYQADASSAMLMIEVLAIFLRMAGRGKEKKIENPLAHTPVTNSFPWPFMANLSFHYNFKKNTSSETILPIKKLAITYQTYMHLLQFLGREQCKTTAKQ